MKEGIKELESHHSATLMVDWLEAVISVVNNFTTKGKSWQMFFLVRAPNTTYEVSLSNSNKDLTELPSSSNSQPTLECVT